MPGVPSPKHYVNEEHLQKFVRDGIDQIGLARTARALDLSPEATLKIAGGFRTRRPTITHALAMADRLTEAIRGAGPPGAEPR